jgi:hypothetical protein
MLILFCMRGCGRIERPAFPAPSVRRVRKFPANLGRIQPRDREVVSANDVVIPAKAGIQYSRDANNNSKGRGVLDRPVKPDDDSSLCWFAMTLVWLFEN